MLLWNFRVVYKGGLKNRDTDYTARVSVNVFGHKKLCLDPITKTSKSFATKQEELTVKFGQLNVRLERLDKDDPVFKIFSHIFR